MLYATPQYYCQTYMGTMPEAILPRLLELASRRIDDATLRGAARSGLTVYQADARARACCMQADFLHRHGESPELAPVRSLKAFEAGVTYAEPANREWFCAEAMAVLRAAGLIERMVG